MDLKTLLQSPPESFKWKNITHIRRAFSGPRATAANPRKVPLAKGIDARRFDQHYTEALTSRKLQIKQRLANARYFYIAPLLLGLIPGKLLAEHCLGLTDGPEWAFVTYASALLITPVLMRYRLLRHAAQSYRQFYMAAIEKCISDEQA